MIAIVSSLLLIVFVQTTICFDSRNIVFTIVSQPEPYHASVATRLKEDIEQQVFQLEERKPIVHITHKDFPVPGAWTIIPLLRPLITKYKSSDVRWVLFVEPHTAVRCGNIVKALAVADRQKDTMWIGYPLSDNEPTIIHHFTLYEHLEEDGGFVYPHFASGFAMRLELMDRLLKQIESGERRLEADFSIDPAFELAQLVYGGKENPGPLLTPDLSFCIVSEDSCATYPRQFDICGSPIPEDLYFVVKTWSGFHSSRAHVVKKTWGRHVTHLQFFSDKADSSLPSIEIGVPNTKTGHCLKTMKILQQVVKIIEKLPNIKWIFLADDDTILGVQRLCEVLSCYRGGDDDTIIGERYGYGYGKKFTRGKGYDYPTGGAGVALSVSAARALAQQCVCTGAAQPDDMALGACARTSRLMITHSPLLHQARPQDYPREILTHHHPASFHRLCVTRDSRPPRYCCLKIFETACVFRLFICINITGFVLKLNEV